MKRHHIYLFGKFEAYCCEQAITHLDAQKSQELLCYLLIHRGRPQLREALAELLWADCSALQARKYLRRTLWQLKAALDCQLYTPSTPTLLIGPDWIQFNPEITAWLDIALFERAFTRFCDVPGRELTAPNVQILQDAVDLYRGELLENWYQDWCLCERERFRAMYRVMLDKLIGYCEVNGHYESGLVHAARILRYDRARKRTHRQLMRLHYLAGDRTTALRQYKLCVSILDDALGVTPTRRTVALYEQIRLDQLVGSVRMPVSPDTPSKVAAAMLPDILDRLNKIHTVLVNAQ